MIIDFGEVIFVRFNTFNRICFASGIEVSEIAKTKRRKQAIQTDEYAFYVKIDRDMPFPDFSAITFLPFFKLDKERITEKELFP